MRLNEENRCHFIMREMFSSKILSRRTKECLYCTYTIPAVTYACETWPSTRGNEERQHRLERKIPRKIHGFVYNNDIVSEEEQMKSTAAVQ